VVKTILQVGPLQRGQATDPKVVVPGSEADGFDSPGGWNQKRDPSDYAEAIELWRRQNARSKRVQHVTTSKPAKK
jgi:hypothetical protein